MMVQTNHESTSPQNGNSITSDARVVNEPTIATINNLGADQNQDHGGWLMTLIYIINGDEISLQIG
jgi:hypothetical protein